MLGGDAVKHMRCSNSSIFLASSRTPEMNSHSRAALFLRVYRIVRVDGCGKVADDDA